MEISRKDYQNKIRRNSNFFNLLLFINLWYLKKGSDSMNKIGIIFAMKEEQEKLLKIVTLKNMILKLD